MQEHFLVSAFSCNKKEAANLTASSFNLFILPEFMGSL